MQAADDIWEPRKLEWQAQALAEHPELDVLFGGAEFFGLTDGSYASPPGVGVLDGGALRDALYRENVIAAPTIMIRRSLLSGWGRSSSASGPTTTSTGCAACERARGSTTTRGSCFATAATRATSLAGCCG